jgi:hypothetical protein
LTCRLVTTPSRGARTVRASTRASAWSRAVAAVIKDLRICSSVESNRNWIWVSRHSVSDAINWELSSGDASLSSESPFLTASFSLTNTFSTVPPADAVTDVDPSNTMTAVPVE